MSVKLQEQDGGKILNVELTGKLRHEDYQHFVPEFEKLVDRHGKIRVLFEMVDFHGWEAAAAWDDIKFDVKHFSDIERIAMVGDKAWEHGLSVFCKPFTRAKLRYFDRSVADEARDWIAQT